MAFFIEPESTLVLELEDVLFSNIFIFFFMLFAARLEEKPCPLLKLGLDILFSVILFAEEA